MSRPIAVMIALALLAACAGVPPLIDNQPPPDSLEAAARAARHAYVATRKLDYSQPYDRGRYRREFEEAFRLLVDVCRRGHTASCIAAENIIQPDMLTSPDAVKRLLEQCKRGDAQSCRPIESTQRKALADTPGWLGRGSNCTRVDGNPIGPCDLALLRVECDNGFTDSCYHLMWMKPKLEPELRSTIHNQQIQGCLAGSSQDCRSVAKAPCQNGNDSFCKARTPYAYHCREWGNSFCSEAADEALERSDPAGARDMYERMCMLDQMCWTLIKRYDSGVFPEPVPGRAKALRRAEPSL